MLRYALFMLLTLMAQNMILSHFRLFGSCPMVLPAVAVAVGMFEGATLGPLFSLIMGIFADMSFVEHTIFFALVLLPAVVRGSVRIPVLHKPALLCLYGHHACGAVHHGCASDAQDLGGRYMERAMLSTVIVQTLWSLPFSAVAYFPPTVDQVRERTCNAQQTCKTGQSCGACYPHPAALTVYLVALYKLQIIEGEAN